MDIVSLLFNSVWQLFDTKINIFGNSFPIYAPFLTCTILAILLSFIMGGSKK